MADANRSALGVEQWSTIREIFGRSKKSTGHYAIASTDPDGSPHITPVGTVFLRDDLTGYYFDQYTSALARNVDRDPRVCVMAVDSGRLFWFRSLLAGRFPAPPAIRLYGTVGSLRAATPPELDQVGRSVRATQRTTGGRMLWSDLRHVRDVTFTEFRPVRYPVMMSGLLPDFS